MANAYSEDLRKKVISHIMSGCGKREAARIFNIGEASIYRWIDLQKTGDLKAKKRIAYPCKVDEQQLKDYMINNPDDTLEQIGQALGLGTKTVWTWLRRLNITRKKRQHSTKNVMKKNAPNLTNNSNK